MDLEEQGRIQRLVEAGERERMVVLLGTPTPVSTRMVATTLQQGDPSYAGPLAGVPLGLPTYHVLEDAVKRLVDPAVYADAVGAMEFALDAEGINSAVRDVRASAAAG